MSPTLIIGTQRPVLEPVLVGNPALEQPPEGWDVLRERLWLPHPSFLPRGSVRQGPEPEGGIFIVQDLRTVEWQAGCPIVDVTSLGIAAADAEKAYKLECSGNLSEDLSLASGEYLTATIWRIGHPRVTKRWVSPTVPAVFEHVGVASVPPDTFGIGGGPWSIAWVAADNWAASGWMGESRVPVKLPGSDHCLVTDTWLYDPGYADRDGIAPGIIYL